jgi:hypothetical protein
MKHYRAMVEVADADGSLYALEATYSPIFALH